MSVQHIPFNHDFLLVVKPKLVKFYHKAILPELAHLRYTSSQAIRETLDGTSTSNSLHETEQQLDKDDRDPGQCL